ncbi:MAG: PTS system mannose/fructose/sorbose family transporter subunit IID, partial [Candidatus Eiseniibacteriota bacterium]
VLGRARGDCDAGALHRAVPPRDMSGARVKRMDLAATSSRSIEIQALMNPERMQGLGFGFALLPVLRRLYPDHADLVRALKRHLAYFATHPVLVGYVLGMAAGLEERRAGGEPIGDSEIDTAKRSLASPLAALGDPLFWVTLRPFAGLVGILGIVFVPSPYAAGPDLRVLLCPLLTLLTYNALAWPFRVFGVARGYALADRPGDILRSLDLAEWNRALARAGAFGFGVLLAAVWLTLDPASRAWGSNAIARVASLLPLWIGGFIGFVGLKRWPGRGVEVGLAVFLAACLLAWILQGRGA